MKVLVSYTSACEPESGLHEDLVGVFVPEVLDVYDVLKDPSIFMLDQNSLECKSMDFN